MRGLTLDPPLGEHVFNVRHQIGAGKSILSYTMNLAQGKITYTMKESTCDHPSLNLIELSSH